MSDYISREQAIDVLKETGIIQDNDLGHLVVDEINRIPTLSETEIIRKAFERVVERLEEEAKANTKLGCKLQAKEFHECALIRFSKKNAFIEAIEILKEECGISE